MKRVARLLLPGLLLVSLYYAVFGGEYSLLELRARRGDLEHERVRLVELETQIDSLSARTDSLRTDDHTLERVARESFGMIKDGETLYRFAVPEDPLSESEDERS
jgi:cell division protein FtsB